MDSKSKQSKQTSIKSSGTDSKIIAKVVKLLGNGLVLVLCSDGLIRRGIVNTNGVWVRVGYEVFITLTTENECNITGVRQ